jgi:hypothetical protein
MFVNQLVPVYCFLVNIKFLYCIHKYCFFTSYRTFHNVINFSKTVAIFEKVMGEFLIVIFIVILDIMKTLSKHFVKNKSCTSYSMGSSGIFPGVKRLRREAAKLTAL